MRSKDKPASLGELLGAEASEKSANEFSLDDLDELLGERKPDMPFNRVGKLRLMNALKMRFGPGYRNIPGVKNIMHEFDERMSTANVIKANKESRNG